VTLLLIIDVVSDILPAIWPCEYALAFHFVVFPLTFVDTTIAPSICTSAFYIIIDKVADILAFVPPDEVSLAVLFPIYVNTLIRSAIIPSLKSFAMLLIFFPLTFVSSSV
jgi:hypothetical protein